jgi:FkbM family methyltransferase
MKMAELRAAFAGKELDKPQYIETAYNDFHRILFEYSANLAETDIREITICASSVVFTIRSSGIRIRCQRGDHRSPPFETFNFADFEPNESRMMQKLFEGCATFFDIGANIGWHSLNLAARHRDASFYCFEPIPQTHSELLENIGLNSFGNISTYNIALSDSTGTQDFYYYQHCSGNASSVDLSERPDVRAIECRQTTLDDFSAEAGLPPPDFIKCDVEGAELKVFLGASGTLKDSSPIIMAEILRKWSRKHGYEPNDIFELLRGMGYRVFTTDGYHLIPFEAMTEETIETNFFFLHGEKHRDKIRRFGTCQP